MTINLIINGQVDQYIPVGISAGTTEQVNFTVYRELSGQYLVTIGGIDGWFNVLSETQPTPPPSQPVTDGGLGGVGTTTLVVVGILLVAGMVFAFRST